MNAEDAILERGAQPDGLAAEGFADAEVAAFEAETAVGIDLADDIVGTILDGRQMLGEAARTDAIATARGRRD